MRVLACVAAAIAAVLVSNACYDPSLKDCQYKCGPGGACPDGTSCMAGYCRTASTGVCAAGSGIDAPGSGSGCPTTYCGSAVKPITGGCAVLCASAESFDTSLQSCGSDTGSAGVWHIAILDSAAKRTEFGSLFTEVVGWVGLTRDATLVWHWMNPAKEIQAPTSPPWAGGEPSTSAENVYGTFDTQNMDDVFRTGSGGDQHKVFCERN